MAVARTNNHCGICIHFNGGIGNLTCGDCYEGSKVETRWPLKQEVENSKVTGIEAKVCEDIAKRQELGLAKYGTTVESNPLPLRDWLQHAYEECLDQAVYLRRAIEEIDKK